MTEVLFYHLEDQRVEAVLPALLEKSLARGWRAVVQFSSDERLDAIDAHLWTFREDSFLPHGTDRDSAAPRQPVLLTTRADNPNGADIRFLVEGVTLPQDAASYQRLVLIFDGADAGAVDAARAQWLAAKSEGHEVTYWQNDGSGRWQRKA